MYFYSVNIITEYFADSIKNHRKNYNIYDIWELLFLLMKINNIEVLHFKENQIINLQKSNIIIWKININNNY